jgi:predicted DNA-binding helix-hairpin-helix protein
MELGQKLAILTEAAKYDGSCATAGRESEEPGPLRLLLTNECVYDCRYCVHRRSSDVPRARLTPEEAVGLTLDLDRRGAVDGLFLSSGVFPDPEATLEAMVEVARRLRQEHGFSGRLHLKVPPGASAELVEEACRWAGEVSVNVELPTREDLERMAPDKSLADIEEALEAAGRHTAPCTQLLVGLTQSSDRAILRTAARLYRRFRLRRVHYTPFVPIPGASPDLPRVGPPPLRVLRLEQADRLLRHAGFEPDELTTPESPDLSLGADPKLAWALRRRDLFPVDVQRAPRSMLLRVPGLGRGSVRQVLELRRRHELRLADLARLGVPLDQAQPFVLTADRNPEAGRLDRARFGGDRAELQQLGLFEGAPG